MSTAKEDVRKLLDQLPEDASLEDIQYQIYVRQKVLRGIEDVHEGRVLPQEDARSRMSRWTSQ